MTKRERVKILKDWVKALRSGEYTQGHFGLCNDQGFCCLGVLCDIGLDAYWVEEFECNHWSINKCGSVLPKDFRKSLGISQDDQAVLYRMNDTDYKSFSEIADYIEANLLKETVNV